MDLAAVILAGGAARRLGGIDKMAVRVGHRPVLHRVLDAVPDAAPRVVVGPPRDGLPGDVVCVQEDPPGGGPAAAIAAGLAVVQAAGRRRVALLAGDLPYLTSAAISTLCRRLDRVDGVVFVDALGHRQTLCGVWRTRSLASRLAAMGDPAGRPVTVLLAGLTVAEIRTEGDAPGNEPSPWFDCDTEDDLRRAGEWQC